MRAASLLGRRPDVRSPGSRARSVRTCQGLRPRRVARALALAHPCVLPSAEATASAPGIDPSIAAQWLAYAFPCRRFDRVLAGTSARLGASVVRYAFTAEDFHLILLAGLPAHSLEGRTTWQLHARAASFEALASLGHLRMTAWGARNPSASVIASRFPPSLPRQSRHSTAVLDCFAFGSQMTVSCARLVRLRVPH